MIEVAQRVDHRHSRTLRQLIDRRLRDLTNAVGVVHACDVDALHHRFDLVAEVGEEAQGIRLLVGDTGI